jgi:hypothetical protein
VLIIGVGFGGATEVDFGPGNPATFRVESDTRITAISPPPPPDQSTVNVTVSTPLGTSPQTQNDLWFYKFFVGQSPGSLRASSARRRGARRSSVRVVTVNAFPRRAPLRPSARMSPLHGATRDPDPFPVQLSPDLVGVVDEQVLLIDPPDLDTKLNVA